MIVKYIIVVHSTTTCVNTISRKQTKTNIASLFFGWQTLGLYCSLSSLNGIKSPFYIFIVKRDSPASKRAIQPFVHTYNRYVPRYQKAFFLRKSKPIKNGRTYVKVQGDQIGRLFTLGVFLKTTEVAHIFGLLLSTIQVMHKFWQKWVGLHFWTIFFSNASGHPG
jgi:hypothetical protein